jgi:hypothetical protein
MKHFNFKAKHPLSVIYGLGLGESRPFLVLFHSLVHRRRLFLPGVRLLALRLLAQVVYAFVFWLPWVDSQSFSSSHALILALREWYRVFTFPARTPVHSS